MQYETIELQQLLREIAGRTVNAQDADGIRLAADTLDSIVTNPMPKEKPAEVSKHKPIAWGLTQGNETSHIFGLRKDAERVCAWHAEKFPHICVGVVPLYRSPTLDAAERDAIEEAIFTCECAAMSDNADADDERREANTVSYLRRILERLG